MTHFKDDNFGADHDDIVVARDTGYRPLWDLDDAWTCGECFVIVAFSNWRQHEAWHAKLATSE